MCVKYLHRNQVLKDLPYFQIANVMDDSAHNKIDTWFTFNEWSEWACVSDGISRRERTCDYDQCVSVDSNGVASISDAEEKSDPSCSSSIHHGKSLSLLFFYCPVFPVFRRCTVVTMGKRNFSYFLQLSPDVFAHFFIKTTYFE